MLNDYIYCTLPKLKVYKKECNIQRMKNCVIQFRFIQYNLDQYWHTNKNFIWFIQQCYGFVICKRYPSSKYVSSKLFRFDYIFSFVCFPKQELIKHFWNTVNILKPWHDTPWLTLYLLNIGKVILTCNVAWKPNIFTSM